MHTVRNRIASRPPIAVPPAALPKVPNIAALRHETAYIQRGSMAMPLASLEEAGLVEPRQSRRRNPKGKKARKAAARLASVREAQALVVALPDAPEPPSREKKPAKNGKAKGKGKGKTSAKGKVNAKAKVKVNAKVRPAAAARKPAGPEQLPAIPASPPLEQRLVAAIPLPSRPEPLVVIAPSEPVRLLTFDAMPEIREEASVPTFEPASLVLPAEPEAGPAPEAEPAPEPEPATALAAQADVPLPRALSLVPARRQGLVEMIALLLRDTGRLLARWSSRRNKTRAEKAALRRAEAQQMNIQRELDALEALRRNRG
jgi:hypothetical protein